MKNRVVSLFSTNICGRQQIHISSVHFERTVNPQQIVENEKRGVFRVLDIGKPRNQGLTRSGYRYNRHQISAIPREKKMKPDQDWPSVWPGPRTFHPASVPLPVRQGFAKLRGQVVPGKYVNTELMKIPNFLHLTPPAIKRQCEALKKFCTAWPEELNDKDVTEAHFPITEITSDYLNSSSTIRDFRSRSVAVQFRVSSLYLDVQSRDKLLRLVGPDRYDAETDIITISADRCPYRKQNSDYCDYLLKALYYESRNHENWESERLPLDQIDYEIRDHDDPVEKKLEGILNEGENRKTLDDYKAMVMQKFKLKNEIPLVTTS